MLKRRYRIWIGLLAIAIGVCFLFFLSVRDNPSYKGKRLSYYMRNMQSRLAENRQPAEEAINRLGSKALPLLCKMIQAEDSAFKKGYIAWLTKYTPLKIHYPSWDYFDTVEIKGVKTAWNEFYMASDMEKQTWAKAAFKMLGSKAQPAFPLLVKAFHRKQSSPGAGAALACLGEEGIQEVLPALHSPYVWLRMSAAGALGETKLPEKFIPSLLEGLNDSDERVRYTTACSLHHLGNTSSAIVIPALAKMLLDPSPTVRTWVIRALSNYGQQATVVIPLLLAMMDDPDSRVKQEAKLAIDLIEMEKR